MQSEQAKTIPFTKMQGAGNDYVYIDCFRHGIPNDPATLAVQVSDRHFGIGADGLILICPTERGHAQMRMFNADGSESEMCGNGVRCVAKYVFDHGIAHEETLKIETGAGVLELHVSAADGIVDRVRVDMGQPILDAARIPTGFSESPVVKQTLTCDGRQFLVTCVSMGNPHCVIFVDEITDELVQVWGPKIEHHPMFPARVNVEFVKVLGPKEVCQRTWERGSGETLACGTGASAVCVAGVLNQLTERRILNHLLGGDLELEWDENTNHVFKTGPAVEVFSGEWPIAP
ncbi:MAG: diaminopimelate epimerase [Pirellulaceae bacterium]